MKTTDLSKFNNDWYNPGGKLKRVLWFMINACIMQSKWFPLSNFKVFLLSVFGAEMGDNIVIKPNVNIKYPWKLKVGDNTWIGEQVWIDNLGDVNIGKNVCISQGAMLLCGNHNYKKEAFDLVVGNINLEDGVWIGAHCVVCPGVRAKSHALLAVNSVATRTLEPYTIYQGNPAVEIRKREIKN